MNYSDLHGSSVADLVKFHPVFGKTFRRFAPDTYEQFIDILYDDIDRIIERLQNQAKIIHVEGEDQLTLRIIAGLESHEECYSATHDGFMNGHCDFVITHKQKNFVWLGEAKIDRGPAYLFGGFSQLVRRYEAGERRHGGMVVYIIYNDDASARMLDWMKKLNEKCPKKYNHAYASCPKREKLSYYSEITHPTSGRPYLVRHLPVMLRWNPPPKPS